MLTDSMKREVLDFLRKAVSGPLALKFCERFDERSKIWNLRDHSHPYLELIYFIDGKASVTTCGDTLDVALYDLVAYPPGVTHRETLDDSSRQEIVCLWLQLDPAAVLPFCFKLTDEGGELGALCQWAHTNHVHKRGHYRELEASLLRAVLLFMEQRLEAEPSSGIAALDRSRAYIAEHYAEDFEVEDLAKVACVTPSYLSRLYKKHLGTSPMRYRNAVRVEKAKQLLLVKLPSVEQIAEVLGFEDTKYFSKLFKSSTGLTPSQFRKKYRSP